MKNAKKKGSIINELLFPQICSSNLKRHNKSGEYANVAFFRHPVT